MRTVDATLTAALAKGEGVPFLKGYIGMIDGTVLHAQSLIGYKLTGQELEFQMAYGSGIAGEQNAIWLERGLTIAGTDYTITTSRFYIHSQRFLPDGSQIARGALFPKQYYSAAGDDTYENVITAFCAAYGKTAVFKDPAAAWLSYQFFPAGKSIIFNDANSFHTLLRQKYLIRMCDKGGEEILVYALNSSIFPATDITITTTNSFYKETSKLHSRYFLWRDEVETIHTEGTLTNPMHNLGYLESTASAPARKAPGFLMEARIRPDLRILDGDTISLSTLGSSAKMFALVSEVYTAPDKSHPAPRWETIVTADEVFGNTPGGAMPSTIERVSNYTPLNTSYFDGILSDADNNMQAAMDTLDNHDHALGALPYAFMPGYAQTAAMGAGITIAANGGSLAIPIVLTAPMQLQSVTIRQLSTGIARTWGWDLYYEAISTNVLTRIAACAADQTFTPSAASNQTIAAGSAPVALSPGLYWLVIQSRHATSTLLIGHTAGITPWNMVQQKTTTNPNGATLDFTAATWTKLQHIVHARLEGRVFGESTAF